MEQNFSDPGSLRSTSDNDRMIADDDWTTVRRALTDFVSSSSDRSQRVLRQPLLADLSANLETDRWIERGELRGHALARFLEVYLGASTRLHHPGYMAHQVAIPEPLAALGALIDGVTNNVSNIYEMGPAAATIEFDLINWMLRKAGWSPMARPDAGSVTGVSGGGCFTSGGSLANLTALLAARSRVSPDAWRSGMPRNLVVIAPDEAHYSIGRAVDMLGLGRDALVAPPTYPDGRIRASSLARCIAGVRGAGKEVLAVVATAGATGSGLFDDLVEISTVCRATSSWMHVDGAHGASALLSQRHRHLLDGLAHADSLVWDAHKMLRTPALCTALLVRDHRSLDAAFHQDASYIFHDKDQPGIDFLHRTLECTRGSLGLRLFLSLATHGERGIAAFIDRQVALAHDAASVLADTPGITLAATPQFNIVCFRFEGDDGLQLELRRRLLARGTQYISTTRLAGRRWLRLALMSPATRLDDIRHLLRELQAHHADILTEGAGTSAAAS